MTLTIPDEVRAKAEIYVGDAAGQEKTRLLLLETGLPSGLLPLKDIIECGYVEETGFVWLKQARKVDHYFAGAGRHVSYAAEVSAVAEQGRLKKITGVKAKEMLIWVTLHEICVDDPPKGKLHCKAIGGLSRTFPVEAFEAEGPPPVFTPRVVPGGGAAGGCNLRRASDGQQEEEKAEGEKEKVEDAAPEKKDAADDSKEEEAEKKEAAAPGGDDVGKVEEKLKEMTTAEVAAHAEAVAAKN